MSRLDTGQRRRWQTGVRGALAFLLLWGALGVTATTVLGQSDACPEPNDAASQACDLPNGSPIQGTIASPDDVDSYRVVVPAGGGIQVDLTDLPADYDLYLTGSANEVMGQSVREGLVPERIQLAVQPGTYYVFVRADPSREVDATRPYTLTLTLTGAAAQAPPTPTPLPTAPPPPPATAVPAPQPFFVGDFRFSYGDINTDYVGNGASLPYRQDTPIRMAFRYSGVKPGAQIRWEMIGTDKFGTFARLRGEVTATPAGQGYPIVGASFSSDDKKFSVDLIIYYEDREVGRGSINVG